MKATVFEIESDKLYHFCYHHGGIRIHDSWFNEADQTKRFLTQDRRHNSCKYYSYVYISNSIGAISYMHIMAHGRNYTVATCKDEEGDNCFIMCEKPKIGDVVEFDKVGFYPYCKNPEPNYWGHERDDDY